MSPRRSKNIDIVKTSFRKKMLCPKCSSDNFKAIEVKRRFSWLFGTKQVFKCLECDSVFDNPVLAPVRHTEEHISTKGNFKRKYRRH